MIRAALFLLLLTVSRLTAQDTPEEVARKAYLANINALMVFTTKEGLNSGTYDFTRANVTMGIVHLPFSYQFHPFKPGWNLFLVGGVGYSETAMTTDLNASAVSVTSPDGNLTLSATNKLQTFAGGVGLGVRYRHESGAEVRGGFETILSRVGITSRTGNGTGDVVEDFFLGKFNDNISYRFFLQARYSREWWGFNPYAELSYELFETKSALNFESLSKFTSQTNVTSFALGSETPPLLSYRGMYLTLEGYLRGSYLGGDITTVSHFDGYGTVGGVGYWYVTAAMNYIRRFFLEISTIQADGLRGYNVGLGFSLDY